MSPSDPSVKGYIPTEELITFVNENFAESGLSLMS